MVALSTQELKMITPAILAESARPVNKPLSWVAQLPQFREPFSGLSHLAGAVIALPAVLWMLSQTLDNPTKMVIIALYGVSMITTFMASAVMHLYNGKMSTVQLLFRFDHAAIYLYIAGTYTPFLYTFTDTHTKTVLLSAVWVLAAAGVFYKLFFFREGWLSLAYYLVMGWLAVFMLPQALNTMPVEAFILIVAGGLLYTLGAVVFGLQRPNLHPKFNFHDLWHVFVLGGSLLHFLVVAWFVL